MASPHLIAPVISPKQLAESCATKFRQRCGRSREGNPKGYAVTKEKAGYWTHWRAFAQVRHSSNIQLLPYSLVSVLLAGEPQSTESGHQADHWTTTEPAPEREDDQRLRWSSAWWSPPPESNRRPHPYHVSPAHRHAIRRFGRSQRTVGGAVMGCRRGPDGPSRGVRATASQLARGSRIVRRPALRLERPGIAAPPTPPPCRRSRWSAG
jgi:hypothetical protein